VTSSTAPAAAARSSGIVNVCLKTVCLKIPEVRGRALGEVLGSWRRPFRGPRDKYPSPLAAAMGKPTCAKGNIAE
ncbi:hypothetical protein TRAPUB_13924, partial [Trametes pubescens]